MTERQLREIAELYTQAANGKIIQVRKRTSCASSKWGIKTDFGWWDPLMYEYRVKPREPREIWINGWHGSRQVFADKGSAYEALNPDVKYDFIAVHFKEVTENEEDD